MNEARNPAILIAGLRNRESRSTLSERVASDIEELILRGELPDGQRLPTEADLVESLGVSRSVVRDAIRVLVARGLVDVRQGHGMVVSAPSDAAFADALMALLMRSELTMGDVIEARAALESELGPLAARNGTTEDWDRMAEHLERFATAVEEKDDAVAYEEHVQFHLGMFSAMHLPALELLLRPVQQYMVFSSLPPLPDEPAVWEVPSHYPILEALRAGDEAATREALRQHFEYMEAPAYADFRAIPFRTGGALEAYRAFRENDSKSRA